ncbi:hypothetical protein CERZMDRAFT_94708 [Cercospora zeae-maydis SCOH1-5]|uniref:Uncharacterized protein n=1 Tax=Cercospora zeae-maydis SCOH1-5 TaxID=717836 RepID=A0A6A6FPH9_9PEZI|nr:hypothetical protein CERZMDRAFT_94708 [Cercospora zeae-maydis SCOH1-5]
MSPPEQTHLRSPLRKLPVDLRLMTYARVDKMSRPPLTRFLDISHFLDLFDAFPDLWQDLSAFTQTISIGSLRRPQKWLSRYNRTRPTGGPIFGGPESTILIKRAWWPLQECCYDTYRLRFWLNTKSTSEDFEMRTCYGRMSIQIQSLPDHQPQDFQDGVGEVLLIPHSSRATAQDDSFWEPSRPKMSDFPIIESGYLQKRLAASQIARNSVSR